MAVFLHFKSLIQGHIYFPVMSFLNVLPTEKAQLLQKTYQQSRSKELPIKYKQA